MANTLIDCFTCEKCNYCTTNKYDWNKHVLTLKHNSKAELNVCKLCNYSTTRKSNYIKHLKTKRHLEKCNIIPSTNSSIKKYNCHKCGKLYKHRQSLHKHLKFCTKNQDLEKLNNNLEIISQQITNITNNNIINNQYNINNKISINLYLNEECKDAMNIEDFIKKINVSFNNLDYSKDNGFAKGIANIVQEQLEDLTPNERPIHCSDKKRLKFYVKEQDKWEKDDDHKNLEKTINQIKVQQLRKLFEWEQQNPNFKENQQLLRNWQKMVEATMGGCTDDEIKKNEKKIKTEISKMTDITNQIKEV